MNPRRFEPYPAYKDSGVEWLGEIPAGWSLKRLKRVVQFHGGGTPAKDNVEYWRGEIPWVSPKDMKVSLVVDTEDKITADAIRESATKLVPAGAVLIVVRSGILVHSIPVALAGCEVTLNQDLKAMIPRSELAPEYLMYLICGMQRELLVEWKKEGATVESLELESVANTPTPLPAIVEQRAIAAFLDRETARIDALVAKKERLIELLQEKRTALITRAVTKGLDPNVPMKDSGVEWLGEIPAHWEVKPLRWAFSVRSGEALPNTEFELTHDEGRDLAVIGGNGVMGYSDRANTNSACIAIGRVGALCGNVHLVEPPAWVTDNALVVSEIRGFDRHYLARFLRVLDLNRWASQNAQPLITGGFVKAQRACAPPVCEQRAIAAFLDRETARIDALVAKVRDAIDRLKELRTALISAAVTGKIDLREEVA